ncbi:hypothetical protein GCM10027168_51890 [Streptomyces capparidis]
MLSASLAPLAPLALRPVPAQAAAPGSDGGGPRGVSAALLASGTSAEAIAVRGRGRTEVVFREITIAPGGSTGWHYHDGPVIVVVRSGTLTRTLSDCSTEVSRPGDSFVEPFGPRRPHTGRNLGTEPVVLYATYLLPEGSPLAVDAPAPDCRDGD